MTAVEVVAWIVAIVVAVPLFLAGWRLGWRHFQYFLSRRDNYRASPWELFVQQSRTSLLGGALLGGAVGLVTYAVVAVVGRSLVEEHLGPLIQPPVTTTVVPAPAVEKPPRVPGEERKVPERPAEAAPMVTSVQESVHAQEQPNQDTKAACMQRRAEIERLEKEKQYDGDDEIVRQRHGLPPKPTC